MNPFDDVVRLATKTRPPLMRAPCSLTREGTYTAALLHLLDCNGPMMTAELASATMMDSRQVWGLLKGPREAGQVRFDDGLWELDRDFPGTNVLRAAELLRSRGWRVIEPTGAQR